MNWGSDRVLSRRPTLIPRLKVVCVNVTKLARAEQLVSSAARKLTQRGRRKTVGYIWEGKGGRGGAEAPGASFWVPTSVAEVRASFPLVSVMDTTRPGGTTVGVWTDVLCPFRVRAVAPTMAKHVSRRGRKHNDARIGSARRARAGRTRPDSGRAPTHVVVKARRAPYESTAWALEF